MTQQPTLEENLIAAFIEWAIAPLLEENARLREFEAGFQRAQRYAVEFKEENARLREEVYHGRNQLRDSDSKITSLEARVKSIEEQYATSQTAMMGNFKRAEAAEARVKELEEDLDAEKSVRRMNEKDVVRLSHEATVAEARVKELEAALEGTLSWLTSYPGNGAINAYNRARRALAQAGKDSES